MESEASKRSKPTKKAESTSAKDSIFTNPTLPQELITEILLRVPVKPVLKFRSVSKSWLALTTSPEFIKAHLTLSANNKDNTHHRLVLGKLRNDTFSGESDYDFKDCSLSSLLNDSATVAFDLDHYPLKDFDGCVYLLGSVNGLICLGTIDGNEFFLWNPSIRFFKKLPGPDYCNRTSGHGFGYDEVHDDYKIVSVYWRMKVDGLHAEVGIYSLKCDSWRRKDGFPDRVVLLRGPSTFVNGKRHWMPAYLYEDSNIISFDLADEEWGEVDYPPCGKRDSRFSLDVLGGSLSLICNDSTSHVDVWIMKEYGVNDSWTKMYTIEYPSNVESYNSTLFVSNKGEILMLFGSNFVIYNLEDRSIRYSKIGSLPFGYGKYIYMESLVCPLLQNEPITQEE